MSGTSASHPLPPSRKGDHDPIFVSPLNPLVPTGYRNIQPFKKGKGWHANGKTSRHRAASIQASDGADIDQHATSLDKERGVVFPLLPGHESIRPGAQGPDVSAVEGAVAISTSADQLDERQEKDEAALRPTVTSPRAPMPLANGAPRRPSRADIRTTVSTGGSFRTRALSRPTSPATTNSDETLKGQREQENVAASGPDPALMHQLWQEYAARSHAANRHVDAAAYHEKMHRRYGEQRALKDRIAQLEQALKAMERERDQEHEQAANASQQRELQSPDRSTSKLSTAASPSTVHSLQAGEPANIEEASYRERSFVLERALSHTQASLFVVREQFRHQSAQAAERTQTLEARLELERNTNLELARQLRQVSAGFTRASAELVETRVSLEREQQRAHELIEQTRVQHTQFLSDTRQAQLETRMKLAVRSLGREALKQKMETLMTRTMRAEQNLRVAQLETERACRERDATREQLEQVLSSHAIKYHSLGATGGIPGILERSTPVLNGSRVISEQLLMLQALYEETDDPEEKSSVHFVAYEPRSAQDDFLTFHLRDIQRLIPNYASYLAPHSVRRRERLGALAELLLLHIHAGYKHGHLVLAETSGPQAATQFPREQLAAQQQQHHVQEVAVYRGTRYLSLVGEEHDDAVLAELNVTEAFAAATSQIWWLEVRAVVLGGERGCDSEALTTKVDLLQLVTFCSTFASYRPSQSLDGSENDPELFAVHETLLEPLFDSLRVVVSEPGGVAKLEVIVDDESPPLTNLGPQNRPRRVSVEKQNKVCVEDMEEDESVAITRTIRVPSRTLTYQTVVNVGDIFYCVRLQELWDNELLLDITMDDPETQDHFHHVLHESQITKLVERLVRDGALEDDDDEAAALQVKHGLASVLYRPLCKLVCSHIRPVLPHPSQMSIKAPTETGALSLGTLFDNNDNDESLRSGVEVEAYEMRGMVGHQSIYRLVET